MKQKHSMTILATGMLFLAGCGGGGSDGPKPLDINAISGLVDSPKPVFAEDEDGTVESLTGTEFGVLSSAIGRVFGDNPDVSLPDSFKTHVASVTATTDGGIDVVFMVDGKAVPFSYSEQELEEGYPGDTKTMEGTEYSLGNFGGLSNQNPLDRKYFELAYWGYYPEDGLRHSGYLVYGARTPVASLPATTASYSGYLFGNFLADDGDRPLWDSHRHSLWGQLKLTADFDDLTISGTVDSLAIRAPEDEGNEWEDLPDTTSITLSKGRIVDGRYTATWTGQDTDADNPMDDSALGFSGQLAGDFYGPAAEETAGVFSGSRDNDGTNEYMYGVFGATTEHRHLSDDS